MPTRFAILLAAVVASVLVLRIADDGASSGQATLPVEQGLHTFDSVLQQGLSLETQEKIGDGVAQSEKLFDASVAALSE